MLRITKNALIATLAGSTLLISAAAIADCPMQGSGAAGVADWFAQSSECENPATTCNGNFTIEFLAAESVGSLVTFTWDVCQVSGQHALSHWNFGLGQFDCLGEGPDGPYTLADLIVGATLNGEHTVYSVGLDPTTQVSGFKFDEGVASGSCNIWSVTLDSSVLAEGYTIGVGCVLAATKAGNQDIRRADRASPGYASIFGPVCEEVMHPVCLGDIADEFGFTAGEGGGPDGVVDFGDFVALLGLIGPCPDMLPGCTGDIADSFGNLGGDGVVDFGDFVALLGLVGPCP